MSIREISGSARFVLAVVVSAVLTAGVLLAAPNSARADMTWGSVSDLPDGGFGQYPMVAMSSDGQVRAYTFRASDVSRQRVVFSTDGGSTYNDHDVTSGSTTSEAGVLGMSDDGQTMAVVYRRWPGTYASLSTDGGSTWSAEQTLSDGASGRAWAPQVAVSGDGQTIVYAWYATLSSKDTAQFVYSTDGGQTWGSTITPSTPGVAIEQDVNVVVSDDGQTIALGWKSDNTTTQGYYSFDGGTNWTTKDISAEGDGTTGSNMPHLGVSGDGSTLAYFWVAGTSVQTAVTSDAGSSWTNKVLSSGRTAYGWPRVLLDKDGSHRLYGWADNPAGNWVTRQSFTSDGGSSWTEDVALSVGTNASGPKLAMSDDGTVMTSAWRERDTNSVFNLHAATTINGGSDWASKQLSDNNDSSGAAIYQYPAVSGDGTAMAYTWQFGPWGSHRIQTVATITGLQPPGNNPAPAPAPGNDPAPVPGNDPAPAPATGSDPAPVTQPQPGTAMLPPAAPQKVSRALAKLKKTLATGNGGVKAMRLKLRLPGDADARPTKIQWRFKVLGADTTRAKDWAGWRSIAVDSQAKKVRLDFLDVKKVRKSLTGATHNDATVKVQVRTANDAGTSKATSVRLKPRAAVPTLPANG